MGLALAASLGLLGCSTPKAEPDYKLVTQAWRTIEGQYVDQTAVEPKRLTYGAIRGMVDSLEDTGHSTFLEPEMVKELKNTERGEFKGVGIEIQMKLGRVVVVAPFDDSPAQRAGIRPGDIISKVGGDDISDWPLQRVIEKIGGGRTGSKITLTIQDPRSSKSREITLARASIKLHQVTWNRLPGTELAHLRLAAFDFGATRDLKKALKAIEGENLKGIVFDLRNNPGGLLDEAIGVASQFLKQGNVLIARDARGQTDEVPVEEGGVAPQMPVVVLVNAGSASAAEIVAGALQDAQRASLLGETTFGTGTVLQQFRLGDGSALLLAVQEWLTPKGRSFWHKGLTPDYAVTLPTEIDPCLPLGERTLTRAQLEAADDRQLLRALVLLENQVKTAGATPRDLSEPQTTHIQNGTKNKGPSPRSSNSLRGRIARGGHPA